MTYRPIVAAALATGVLCSAPPAAACMFPQPQPPAIGIVFNPDGSVWIVIHGFETHGALPGQFCACALNQLDEITSVNAVIVVDAKTGIPITGFDFHGSANADFGGGVNWAGFLSGVSADIEADVVVDIKFHVNVVPGTTFNQLAAALGAAPAVIGTDEANRDGSPAGTHQSILPAGKIILSCPWDCTDMNGTVATADLLTLVAQWGEPGSCDFDGSGTVSTQDLLELLGNWGPCPK